MHVKFSRKTFPFDTHHCDVSSTNISWHCAELKTDKIHGSPDKWARTRSSICWKSGYTGRHALCRWRSSILVVLNIFQEWQKYISILMFSSVLNLNMLLNKQSIVTCRHETVSFSANESFPSVNLFIRRSSWRKDGTHNLLWIIDVDGNCLIYKGVNDFFFSNLHTYNSWCRPYISPITDWTRESSFANVINKEN